MTMIIIIIIKKVQRQHTHLPHLISALLFSGV
jgi:hypothetical protein